MSQQNFELYNYLSNFVKNTDQNINFDLNEVCSKIVKLDEEKQTIIGALIYHYWVTVEKNNINKLKKNIIPYSGKTVSENKIGIIFYMDFLPELLQKIIIFYVNML